MCAGQLSIISVLGPFAQKAVECLVMNTQAVLLLASIPDQALLLNYQRTNSAIQTLAHVPPNPNEFVTAILRPESGAGQSFVVPAT